MGKVWNWYRRNPPERVISWQTEKKDPRWKKWNGHYHRSNRGGGSWEFRDLPEVWQIRYGELSFRLKPFQFKQGLDLRLMTPEKAQVLSRARYYGDYIFAFDHIEDAEWIEKKLQLWREYCDKPTKLYVLSGFDGQDENEIVSVFERIRILLKYGCLPYIMRHEKYLQSPYKGMFIQIARWCNQPRFLKKLSFRQYCEQCQVYYKGKGLCAPMKAMTEFERKFPVIAAK